MINLLARLHSFDVASIGLSDFGNTKTNYYDRQIKTWSTQYRAAETEKIPAME